MSLDVSWVTRYNDSIERSGVGMEWYQKHKRTLALITLILFVTGLILILIGMNAVELTALGTVGSIILFVSFVPLGAIWILHTREKDRNQGSGLRD